MGSRKKIGTTALAAIVMVCLSGCASPLGLGILGPAGDVLSVRAGSPITLIPGVGHVVPEGEAGAINGNSHIEEKAYELQGGQWVVTNPNIALPEIVTQDVATRVKKAVDAASMSGMRSDLGIIAVHHEAERASGRRLVIVTRSFTTTGSATGGEISSWVAYDGGAVAPQRRANRWAAIAAADAFVAAQPVPSGWDIASS